MNITESLIRIAILIALALLGGALCLGEEIDEDIWAFTFHVIFDKAVGVACLYAMAKLYSRWSKTDNLIARFDAWNAKGIKK